MFVRRKGILSKTDVISDEWNKICKDILRNILLNYFRFPAGIGGSCVIKTPWNGTLDRLVQSNNYSSSVNLRGKYFDRMCEESFKKGEPLSNYVPKPPQPLPPPEESEFDGKWED